MDSNRLGWRLILQWLVASDEWLEVPGAQM
jgi:hypothetical protein